MLSTVLTAGPSLGGPCRRQAAHSPLYWQVHKGEGVVKEVDAGKGPNQDRTRSHQEPRLERHDHVRLAANAGLLTGIKPGDKVTFELGRDKTAGS